MERYEIHIAGHLDQRRAHALGCDELRLLPGGIAVLTFSAVDQAALYGLLTRLRDAGLELIAIERMPLSAQTVMAGARTTERSKERRDAAE